MKYFLIIVVAALALGGDPKPLPGQAGNDDIELVGTPIIDRAGVTDAIGVDMGIGFILVRMKVTPKTTKPLAIGPDDFTIISRKDGQRSIALAPGQIAGKGALIVKASPNQPGGAGTATNGPIWGGVGPIGMGRNTAKAPAEAGADPHMETDKEKEQAAKDNPLLAALKAKILPDKESLEPVEGLLYFSIDGKLKPKDLAVIYKGPAGKLVMEFVNPK
jgi:hypothetical protein